MIPFGISVIPRNKNSYIFIYGGVEGLSFIHLVLKCFIVNLKCKGFTACNGIPLLMVVVCTWKNKIFQSF